MAHRALARTEHRPWPLPPGTWRWAQSWRHLLFAHWPVPARWLRPHVPGPLSVQEFGGTGWVGVIPFLLGVRRRFAPPVPGASLFPELNVRTYVELDGKPGIWFFSLDANSRLAAWTARRLFHLPYYRARMRCCVLGDRVRYASRRLSGTHVLPEFRAEYGPESEVFVAQPGSLDYFLTERYCLFAADAAGRLYEADVHHAPWPLQQAWARIEVNSMLAPLGIDLTMLAPGSRDPVLHFAQRVDALIWPLRPATSTCTVRARALQPGAVLQSVYPTRTSLVTRPVGTHSTTKMLPSAS